MKKLYKSLVMSFILGLLFLSSCSLLASSDEHAVSAVTVVLPQKNTREKYTQDEVSYYNLRLLTQEGEVYGELPVYDGGPAVFEQVLEGTYMIKAQAFSLEDQVVAEGQSDLFQVKAGEENLVDLTMSLSEYFILTLSANIPGLIENSILKTGAKLKAPDCPFTNSDPANSIFNGWATTADATEGEYYPGDFITLTGNKTLYAVWSDHITVKSFAVLKYAAERGIKNIYLGATIYIGEDFTLEGTSDDEYMIDGRGEYNIFSSKDCTLTFSYVSFKNGCGEVGGMISKSTGSLVIRDCIFNNCKTRDYGELGSGGVISVTNASLTIEGSTFSNSAYTDADPKDAQASYGGILYVGSRCPSVTIKNTEFKNGYAINGGAIMLFSSATIDGCSIHNNISGQTDPSNNNAAVEISDLRSEGIVVNITNCTFYENMNAELTDVNYHVMISPGGSPTVNLAGSKDSYNSPIELTPFNL